MLKKIFVYLLFFIILINPVFSGSDSNFLYNSFEKGLGINGLGGLIMKDIQGDGYVTASLIFIALLVTFHNLLCIGLKMALPKKEANIIAFSISLIGNLGMIFIFNGDGGVKGYVGLFGGTIGITFIAIIFLTVIKILDTYITLTHQRFKSRVWWFGISLAVFFATTVITNLLVKIYGSTDSWLWTIFSTAQGWSFLFVIGVGISFFIIKKRGEIEESESHKIAKNIFKNLDDDINSIDNSFKKIKENI